MSSGILRKGLPAQWQSNIAVKLSTEVSRLFIFDYNLFCSVASTYLYEMRSTSSGLQWSNVRTEMGKKAFTYRGAHRWNSLPASVRAGKATAIKAHLLIHLL